MLTQLVQEMRVGNHIPYRRSECALGRASGGWRGQAGGRREGPAAPGVPGPCSVVMAAPSWGTREGQVHEAPLPPVVYYMEGRDSMQLIYRWTKSLDPRLRKGLWTPEEDTVGVGAGRAISWEGAWTLAAP